MSQGNLYTEVVIFQCAPNVDAHFPFKVASQEISLPLLHGHLGTDLQATEHVTSLCTELGHP